MAATSHKVADSAVVLLDVLQVVVMATEVAGGGEGGEGGEGGGRGGREEKEGGGRRRRGEGEEEVSELESFGQGHNVRICLALHEHGPETVDQRLRGTMLRH